MSPPIKEPPLTAKQVFKNVIPSKLNKRKRGGLAEIEGALCNSNGIRPLKLRNQSHVQKGTKIGKTHNGERTSVVSRKVGRHRFWKRTHKKSMGVSL